MDPIFFLPIIMISLLITGAWSTQIHLIWTTPKTGDRHYNRASLYPFYRLHTFFFALWLLVPISAVAALLDYAICNEKVVLDTRINDIQVIKHDNFSEQFVLDKNGKVVIMDGWTDATKAKVESFYY